MNENTENAILKISGWERVESSEFGIYYANHTPRPVRISLCPTLHHIGMFAFSWCSIAYVETNASGSTSNGISRSSASVGAGQSLPVRRNPLLVGVLHSCSSRTRSQIEMGVVPAAGTRLLRQCPQNVCTNRNWNVILSSLRQRYRLSLCNELVHILSSTLVTLIKVYSDNISLKKK